MINDIKPKFKRITKYFDWGEPFETIEPLFNYQIKGNSNLEKSINLFEENNFKNQILNIYNCILNSEESKILNLEDELDNKDNKLKLLEIIRNFIKENEKIISPWVKFKEMNENDYINQMEKNIDFKLCYIEIKEIDLT